MAVSNMSQGNVNKNSHNTHRRHAARKPRAFIPWLVATSFKLFFWYALVTALFRCPTNIPDIDESSPSICRPVIDAKSYLEPHVRPYYDTYLAHHVEKVQPYYENTKSSIVLPTYKFTRVHYDKYAQPLIKKFDESGRYHLQHTVKPRLDDAQAVLVERFHTTMGPYVTPYYKTISTSARDLWEIEIYPAYRYVAPYATRSYHAVEHFTRNTALPQTRFAIATTCALLQRHVLPTLQILYGENIEPQIVKISQRLLGYRDNKKLKAAVESTPVEQAQNKQSTRSSSSPTHSSSDTTSTEHAAATSVAKHNFVVESEEASADTDIVATSIESISPTVQVATPSATQLRELTPAEQIAEDLQTWEIQMSKAITDGTTHLEDRISEIAARQQSAQVNKVGEALLVQMQETANSAYKGIKSKTHAAAKSLGPDSSDKEVAQAVEKLSNRIRLAGQTLKIKAQGVRTWRQALEKDTNTLVEAAANSTIETIDNIRQVRLQDIGSRWASNQALTHQDWARYNEIKKSSNEWHSQIVALATNHKGLAELNTAANDIEERAMSQAETMANELMNLKKTAQQQLEAREPHVDSEDAVEQATAYIKEKIMYATDAASSAMVGSSTGSLEAMSSKLSSQVQDAVSGASSAVLGSPTGSVESIVSAVTNQLADSSASARSIVGNAASHVQDSAGSATAAAKSRQQKLSSVVADTIDSVSQHAKSLSSHLLSSVSSSSSNIRVAGGAMAQAVPNREIVLDHVIEEPKESSYSDAMQNMVNDASDGAQVLTRAIKDALSKQSLHQPLQSASSVAAEQYASAMAAASSVLYGTPTAAGMLPTVIAEKYDAAVEAASSVLYGTQTPLFESLTSEASATISSLTSYMAIQTDVIASKASSRYSEALSMASAQSVVAVSHISVQMSGTPSPIHQQMLASVTSAYNEAISAASVNIDHVLQKASPTQNVYESISSVASIRLASGLSLASSQYSNAKSLAGLETQVPQQQYLGQAQQAYYQGVGMAYDQYSSFLNAATSAVSAASTVAYGTPTPTYQSVLLAAQERYSNAVSLASEKLTQATAAALSIAGAASPDDSLLSSASSQYNAAVTMASEALYGTRQPVYASILSQAQLRYSSLSVAAGSSAQDALSSVKSAVGATPLPAHEAAASTVTSGYNAAMTAASEALASASSYASAAMYGTSTGAFESATSAFNDAMSGMLPTGVKGVVSQASQNYDAILSLASAQIYTTVLPLTSNLPSAASSYATEVTSAASAQYVAMVSIFSELISGREPDFTESVMNKLNSAFYTGAPAIVASATNQAVDAYSAASSLIAPIFTPPPSLEVIISNAKENIDAVVDAASSRYYDTTNKPIYDDVTSAIGSNIDSVSSAVSAAILGTTTGYAEAAQSSVSAAVDSAQEAISLAIFGTTSASGTLHSATSIAADGYSAVTSVAAAGYSGAADAVSSALYGAEQGALESASSRMSEYMESARSKMALYGQTVGGIATEQVASASSAASSVASSVSSAVSSAVVGSSAVAGSSAQAAAHDEL